MSSAEFSIIQIPVEALTPIRDRIFCTPRPPHRGKRVWFGGTTGVMNNPWEQELEVVSVGSEVTDIVPGDRIMVAAYTGNVYYNGHGMDDRFVTVKRDQVVAKVSRDSDDERVVCDARGHW
ncbi:MAG: hypothetical protein ACI88C_000065 [Acidimicrobiales bacterium]|jgi:hypothetical protein